VNANTQVSQAAPQQMRRPAPQGQQNHAPQMQGQGQPQQIRRPAPQGQQNHAPQMHGQGQPQQMRRPAPQGQQNRAPQMQGQQPQQMRRPAPQGHPQQPQVTLTSIAQQDFNEADIRELYGDVNAGTKIKLEKRKNDIETRRVAILKEIAFALDDAKKKIKANSMAGKFIFLAIIFCPIIMASAMSDVIKKLLMDTTVIRGFFPLHMRVLVGYALLLFVTSLMLKQGIFLFFQDKLQSKTSALSTKVTLTKNIMLGFSSLLFLTVGGMILYFYLFDDTAPLDQGTVLVTMLCLATLLLCSLGAGYFQAMENEALIAHDKYESREDFKSVLQDYQQWIGLFINNLSNVKIKKLQNKQFSLNLKAWGERFLGILTAPFLAYAVSNTLGACVPDAAGWIRISGLRITPVFLTLATLMIIFAFFTLSQAFTIGRRINGSEVIKNDGFDNYMNHGVDLYGTDAVKKLKEEGFKSLVIACSIIFIEFTMNASYFMQEIGGGEWSGIGLSVLAALVPTALLVTETFMLAHTQYELYTCNEIIERVDKDFDE
jgi:hypothetical protein